MDLVIRPFGPHVIIEPHSRRASRFVRRFMKTWRYPNGVYSISDAYQAKRLGEFLRHTRMTWRFQ